MFNLFDNHYPTEFQSLDSFQITRLLLLSEQLKLRDSQIPEKVRMHCNLTCSPKQQWLPHQSIFMVYVYLEEFVFHNTLLLTT